MWGESSLEAGKRVLGCIPNAAKCRGILQPTENDEARYRWKGQGENPDEGVSREFFGDRSSVPRTKPSLYKYPWWSLNVSQMKEESSSGYRQWGPRLRLKLPGYRVPPSLSVPGHSYITWCLALFSLGKNKNKKPNLGNLSAGVLQQRFMDG